MTRFDPLGFPLAPVPAAGLEVGVLPVTRAQFDYFLGDTAAFPADSYADLDRTSPRASWRHIPADRPEGVFLTAVRPDEAERFAAWLGHGFRLPTADEWRAADRSFDAAGAGVAPLEAVAADPEAHPAARAILGWALARPPATWRTAGRFADGHLEWVRHPAGGYGLLGRPRPGLVPLILNPQKHDPVRPTSTDRHPGFGFRLVRPLPPPGVAS